MSRGADCLVVYIVRCIVAMAAVLSLSGLSVSAQVLYEDQSQLGQELNLPLNKWSDPSIQPVGVVVALHGLVMHGGTFNGLARQLVSHGFVVVSMDFRGQGRWYKTDDRQTLDYQQGEKDLVSLAQAVRASYPNLPVFYVGESLGADMSIRLAAQHHDLVDGLILSSPAIKRQSFISARMISDIMGTFAMPHKQVNLTPYMKRCVSDDSRVTEEILNDPLVRKNLSRPELLHSCQVVKATLRYVDKIPADMPILILQGSNDRTVKANAVVLLLSHLRSNDQTVRWLPQCGHVLLETQYLQPLAIDTVSGWLLEHQRRSVTTAAQPGDNSVTINASVLVDSK